MGCNAPRCCASVRCRRPLIQLPFGWAPSEVFYNQPALVEPLKLDACAIAGILNGTIDSWDAPALQALNPGAALPADAAMSLVYLNLSMPISTMLSTYLSAECPSGWPYGVLDNLDEVVAGVASE